MAKIQLGPVVQDARNKIANTVFSKNRAGAYVRKRVSPTQPQTAAQRAIRSALTSFTRAWAALTDAQRLTFDNLATANPIKDIFGNSIKLTGHQMFVRLSIVVSDEGGAALTTAPANLNVTQPTVFTFTAAHTGPAVSLTALTPLAGANEKTDLWGTQGLSAGRSFVTSFYRILAYQLNTAVQPFDAHTQYVAKFGTPIAGQRIALGAVYSNSVTGAQSSMITANAIVGA